MIMNLNERIRDVATYSEHYKEKYLKQLYPEEGWENSLSDNLRFLFGHVFYQGRNDKMSGCVDRTAQAVFNLFIRDYGEKHVFDIKNGNTIVSDLNLLIGTENGKAGKGGDLTLAKSLLYFITSKEERNLIVPYTIKKIKAGEIREHYKELDDIFMIGDKIASFYLRDVVSLFELDSYVLDDELIYLQPIDTWVKKVSQEIGITEQKDPKKIRHDIVNRCLEAKVNPQEFNMGAWLLGTYPYEMHMWRLNRA